MTEQKEAVTEYEVTAAQIDWLCAFSPSHDTRDAIAAILAAHPSTLKELAASRQALAQMGLTLDGKLLELRQCEIELRRSQEALAQMRERLQRSDDDLVSRREEHRRDVDRINALEAELAQMREQSVKLWALVDELIAAQNALAFAASLDAERKGTAQKETQARLRAAAALIALCSYRAAVLAKARGESP